MVNLNLYCTADVVGQAAACYGPGDRLSNDLPSVIRWFPERVYLVSFFVHGLCKLPVATVTIIPLGMHYHEI